MDKVTPEIGKVYRVQHSRQGVYWGRCVKASEREADGDGSADFEIIRGKARFASGGGYYESTGAIVTARYILSEFRLEDPPAAEDGEE